MITKTPTIILFIIFAFLLSLLPIYPLWAEGREISQTGETLYQELRFVSLAEYNASEIFARNAWGKPILVIYIVLKIVNYIALFTISWLSALLLVGLIKRVYLKT